MRHHPNHHRQRQEPLGLRDHFNLMVFTATSCSICFWPLFRRRFGTRAFGMAGVVAPAIILVFAASMKSGAVLAYFWVWLALVLVHRLCSMNAARRGAPRHSRYRGDSWIAGLLPGIRTEEAAKRSEPFLALIVAISFAPCSQGLSAFFILGFFALATSNAIGQQANRMRVQQMRDAFLEQQWMGEQFKDR